MQQSRLQPQSLGLSPRPDAVFELAGHEQTQALGHALGLSLKVGDFLGLVGGLGAGKTTLVQGLVGALDEKAEATSPSYALVNLYELEPPVLHMDLYRLEGVDDLESTGYWDYVDAGDRIMCVEWLDRIPQAWPGAGLLIELSVATEGRRASVWASPGYAGLVEQLQERFAAASL
ncbi:MAG: tRNA (adenosine(37)-N6)-threonylcarbamoyltransferase complex ATPase subunit type 1 TsaE [Bradymonadaceae bacterium]|nr:tRNA (adenosine(37)-N6)-threonylcarbamoyltransferase complex ATPase subunit type 1 TsaE [Lujinxingiaceae bacterium]